MNINRETRNTVLIFAGAYIGWQFVLAPLLETFNLKDSKSEREAAETQKKVEQLDVSKDYWNPNFYSKPPSGYDALILTSATVDNLAATIWNAAGWFNDDEEAIYGAFRALKYRTQVSFLARRFYERYRKDLYTWLRDSVLNSSELNTVLNITNKLPNGFKSQKTGTII